jgi:O-succinylbenzoate synthase
MPLPAPVDELLRDAHVVAIPLRVPFRGVREREALLLRGPAGWGEFSPFLEYDDDEAARWLACGVEAAWTGWPAPRRSSIPVNATVPAVAADGGSAVLQRFPGCTTAKVKVAERGQSPADDVARVRAVRDAWVRRADPGGRQRRLDGGPGRRGAGRAGAVRPRVRRAAVRHGRGARRAAPRRLPGAGGRGRERAQGRGPAAGGARRRGRPRGAQGGPLSGWPGRWRSRRPCGLPVVVSSALDTSVGISAGLALAAALPELPYACGLATTGLFTSDVAELPVVDGHLPVGAVVPDEERLRELTAAPERVRWWHERLRRCADLL